MHNARYVAAQALLRVERTRSWSNMTLDSLLRKEEMDGRDAAFAGALFYGVLERLLTLDACIAAHSKQPLKKLGPAVRQVLRLSIYQLLYMDSVPDHAAVSEGVALIKDLGNQKASGFVNGVLRGFLRAGKQVPLPDFPQESRWSVEYSCPEPLVRLWLEAYGEADTLRILEGSLGKPPVYLRVNTLKTTAQELIAALAAEGVEAKQDEELENCLLVSGQGDIARLAAYRDGLFHVQDKSSQLCVEALDVYGGMDVLDACAAPGGKSFTIAQKLAGTGSLTAAELHEKRVSLLARRAGEMGIGNLTALCADMTKPLEGAAMYDRVLCDVPCSGYGVIRRKPEIKYKDPKEFAQIFQTQYKILSNAAKYCKAGGRLLYSTCTWNPAENDGIAGRFLDGNPDFAPAPLPALLGGTSAATLFGAPGGDGFFMAAFERKG